MTYTPGSVLAGGLRARMIFDNLVNVVQANLITLGWFDSGRRHKPIRLEIEQQDTTQAVPINTLAISDAPVSSAQWEIGSNLTEDTRWFFIDFFGESDAVSKHLIGDVRDIITGKFASLGRTMPVIEVYDLRQATPPLLFGCTVVQMREDRSHVWTHPWERHWYSLHFALYDYYNNDMDDTVYDGPLPYTTPPVGSFGFGTFGGGSFGGG